MNNQRGLNNSFNDLKVSVLATCMAVLLSVWVLLDPSGIAFAQAHENPSHAQDEKDVSPLEVGKPVERELAGGHAHYYRISIEAGQYMHFFFDDTATAVVDTLSLHDALPLWGYVAA